MNKDITILSNNCIAGYIYHELNMRFNSPTINLYIDKDVFMFWVKHLKEYIDADLIEIKEEGINYPIGILRKENLKDIRINFLHYKSFEEAKDKWIERYKRINYDNIYLILDIGHDCYDIKELLDEFNSIDIEHKIALVSTNVNALNTQKMSCYDGNWHGGLILEVNKETGKRNIEEWDYKKFLNIK